MFSVLSCTTEETGGLIPQDKVPAVRLELDIPSTSSYSTKAAFQENTINEIDVLVFKNEEGRDKFLYHQAIPDSEITEGPGNKKIFTMNFDTTDISNGVRLMILANSHNEIETLIQNNVISEGTDREIVHKKLTFDGKRWMVPYISGNVPLFPMCGLTTSHLYPSQENDMPVTRVTLYRSLARIDVGVDIYNSTSALRNEFQIKEISVMGINQIGCITRLFDEELYDPVEVANLPEENTRLVDLRNTYVLANASYAMEGQIYVPESDVLNIVDNYVLEYSDLNGPVYINPNADPKTLPYNGVYLIIKATYKGQDNRYYRIDMEDTDGYCQIVRNHKYVVNIMSVNNNGHAAFTEAMNDISTNGINSFVLGEEDADIVHIATSGKYLMGTDKNEIAVAKGGNYYEIKIKTTYSKNGQWQCTARSENPEWLNVNLGTPTNKGRFALTVSVSQNGTNAERQGKIIITSGTIQMEVNVMQSGS